MSSAAERAGEAGMEQALHAERVAEWRRRADRWLDELPQGKLFTSDDLVEAIGKPDPDGPRNNAIGGWIKNQVKLGRTESSGRFARSTRVEGHSNRIEIWRVKDQRVGGGAGRASTPQRERADVASNPKGPRQLAKSDFALASEGMAGGGVDNRLGPDGGASSNHASAAGEYNGAPSLKRADLDQAAEDFYESERQQTLDDFAPTAGDAPGFETGGEQLGLLAPVPAPRGAYTEAA